MTEKISSERINFRKSLDLDDFVMGSKQIVNDYRCFLCDGIFMNPVVDSCGHIFCSGCIDRWLEVQTNCPLSNMPLVEKCNPVNLISNILNKQTVLCKNKNFQCDWTGCLADLEEHLNITCPRQTLVCKLGKCGNSVFREDIQKHEELCEWRIVNCADCHIEIAYIEIPAHQNSCPKFKIYCPQECQTMVERQHVINHISNECANTVVDCPYADISCSRKMMKKDLEAHLNSSFNDHNIALKNNVMRLLSENIILKDEINFLRGNPSQIKTVHNSPKNDIVIPEPALDISFINELKITHSDLGKGLRMMEQMHSADTLEMKEMKEKMYVIEQKHNEEINELKQKIKNLEIALACINRALLEKESTKENTVCSDKEKIVNDINSSDKVAPCNNRVGSDTSNFDLNDEGFTNRKRQRIEESISEIKIAHSEKAECLSKNFKNKPEKKEEMREIGEIVLLNDEDGEIPLMEIFDKIENSDVPRNITSTSTPEPQNLPSKTEYFDNSNISKGINITGSKIMCQIIPGGKIEHKYCFANVNLNATEHAECEWKVKLHILSNWAAVGVCVKETVINNKYKFVNSNQTVSNGTWAFSSNGYTWNCLNPSENNLNIMGTTKIEFGDTIVFRYKNHTKELFYKIDGKMSGKLTNIHVPKNQTLTPCFIFLHQGDELILEC
jgi:hypothetical protein